MATDSEFPAAPALGRDVLEQVVAACSDGVLLLDARDPERKIVYVNPAYESMSGYTSAELIGAGWRLIGPGATPNRELDRLNSALERAADCDVILADVRKDGKSWLSRLALRPVHDASGELQFFACLQRPIANKRGRSSRPRAGGEPHRLETERTQRVSVGDRIDPSSGLLRFEYFVEQLERDVAIARRVERPVAVLLFEIVELDVYRQTFGSNAADSCLRMIGAQLTGVFRRAGDLCARCGAATLIAASHAQDESQAAALARRVTDKVRGLGLHNPRGHCGRYLGVRSAVVTAAPGTAAVASVVETAKAQLAAEEPAGSGGAPAAAAL